MSSAQAAWRNASRSSGGCNRAALKSRSRRSIGCQRSRVACRVENLRRERKLPVADRSLHLVLSGNPGTGAIFILIARAAADTAGPFNLAMANNRHRAL